MSEMIERVAKAMRDCQDESWQELPWEVLARAAIAAMREPTEEMIEAWSVTFGQDGNFSDESCATADWQAMIDAALAHESATPIPAPDIPRPRTSKTK